MEILNPDIYRIIALQADKEILQKILLTNTVLALPLYDIHFWWEKFGVTRLPIPSDINMIDYFFLHYRYFTVCKNLALKAFGQLIDDDEILIGWNTNWKFTDVLPVNYDTTSLNKFQESWKNNIDVYGGLKQIQLQILLESPNYYKIILNLNDNTYSPESYLSSPQIFDMFFLMNYNRYRIHIL